MRILLPIFLLFSFVFISCVKDRDNLITKSSSMEDIKNQNNKEKRIKSLIELAINSIKNKNYPSAYDSLFKAKNIDPKHAQTYNILGLTYLYDLKYSKAIENFKIAVSLKKNFSQAHLHLGIAYGELKEYNKSINEFKIVINDIFYPTPWKAYTNLGRSYFLIRDYKNAIKSFNDSLSKSTNQCIPYELLGEIYSQFENVEEALYNFDIASKKCKNKASIYKKIALFMLKQKRKKEASKYFNLCIKNTIERNLEKECKKYIELIR